MPLFDAMTRTNTANQVPNTSSYTFLNQTAIPKFSQARDLLEQWFSNYPSSNVAKLLGDFKARDEAQFLGAFFELYCYSLLRFNYPRVEIERIITKSSASPIDFVVYNADKLSLFCMEATVALDSANKQANKLKQQELFWRLQAVESPHFAAELHVLRESKLNIPYKALVSEFKAWLTLQNIDEVRAAWNAQQKQFIQWRWEKNEWDIELAIWPKEEGAEIGPVLGMQSFSTEWDPAKSSLANALESKAKKYGIPDMPYIIAVDVLATNSLLKDLNSIGEVLFGQTTALVDPKTGTIREVTRVPLTGKFSQDRDGFWVGKGGRRNEHISGVLFIHELMPWSIAKQTPILWHNPWAAKPLDPSLWKGHQLLSDFTAIPPVMKELSGQSAVQLFQIDLTAFSELVEGPNIMP